MNKKLKCKSIWFFICKVMIPLTLLICIPLIPILYFDPDMTNLGLKILLQNDRDVDLAIQMLKYLNFNVTYLVSVLLFISMLNFFRKKNAKHFFNANSNYYYNYYYIIFWIASNILGYEKIQLAGLPMHIQFKIVLRATFPLIIPDSYENHYDKNDSLDNILTKYSNFDTEETGAANIIISDTYYIEDKEIDSTYQSLPTVRVSSSLKDRRYINNELVQKTREAVELLRRKGFTEINIFSTANPQNNLNIINSSFRFFGRFVNSKIYVFQKCDGNQSDYLKRYLII